MRRALALLVAAVLLALALYAGLRGAGPVPPLGALLDPAHGTWALAASAGRAGERELELPGLDGEVRIVYDDRAVPHIFAESEMDAYTALGWAVARDRLFQMEVQARAGGGRLTELVGSLALEIDRDARALGLGRGAERKAEALPRDGREWRALEAYARGVNAWIDRMPRSALPLEYRLLGATPARWEPLHSVYLMQRMGWTLAFGDEELVRARARALVGTEAADALFPVSSPIQEPIQPNGRQAPRFEARRLPPPGEPDLVLMARALEPLGARSIGARSLGARSFGARSLETRTGDVLGSNNWAVAPGRTRDGYAILAGDPHLELTLPSIWYEAHLVVPGELDTYGVTIPGAPLILIGFNRDIAWTFTNTQADVLDLYRETVDDAERPTRYRLDGEWRPLTVRVEEYRDRAGRVLAADTVRYTHRGPMRRIMGTWLSHRWTVLEPGGEIEALLDMMRAGSVQEFLEATKTYGAPAQNMLVADRTGSIAIRSTGRYPLRAGDGRGTVIRDGSTSRSDWTGDWPLDRYPQAIDPAQGFLASANQQPLDPRVDAGYLGAIWPPPWRAMRINELLRANDDATPDEMRRMQTDPGSARADLFVPAFIAAARARADAPDVARAATLLAEWDRRYTPDNERAVLFEYAMRELSRTLWDELRDDTRPQLTPSDAITALLLADPTSAWWDVRGTPGVEQRDEILARSLGTALSTVVGAFGRPEGGGWRWSRQQQARIDHVLGLPALSSRDLPVSGGPSTISPSSGSGRHGASWRMVVELGPDVRAWGIYPGGQSGNPLSADYRTGIAKWRAGELDTLRVPRSVDEAPARERVTLRPGGTSR